MTQIMGLLSLAPGHPGGDPVVAGDGVRSRGGHGAGFAADCGGGGLGEAEGDVEQSRMNNREDSPVHKPILGMKPRSCWRRNNTPTRLWKSTMSARPCGSRGRRSYRYVRS